MLGCDFTAVETVALTRLYVLFVVALQRCLVHLVGVTAHPTGEWVAQTARNLLLDIHGPGGPVPVPDPGSGQQVHCRVRPGVRRRRYRSRGDAAAGAEGQRLCRTVVRTVRAECLARTLIWNQRHLHNMLNRYVEHYNAG
jgi:putative transposase